MKQEKKWWKECVVYQIYPRSFKDSNGDGIGDLQGVISKLDYLKELGIDVIWMSPVYQSPNDDNGYDISDYQAIMEEFGTMDDFDQLLATAHEKGIKIVMDLVVNHSSDEHKWFIESKKSKDNPYRDYYIWRDGKNGKEPTNWGSWFGGPAWEYDKDTDMYYLHIFSKKQPDLNWDNEALRNEVYRMMTWWLDKGIDGFRMDVISLISKAEEMEDGATNGGDYGDLSPYCLHGPHVHEYLKEMNEKVLSKYDIMTVGETAGVTIAQAKKYAGFDSNELNTVFQFELMGIDEGIYGKWNDERFSLLKMKQVMTKWQTKLEGKSWNCLFWNNHDQPRVVSRFGNDKEYREISAKMLGTCLHMMQGTPYVYQGEELGMTNVHFDSIESYRDIECINAYNNMVGNKVVSAEQMMKFIWCKSRDNARTPMQWDDSENAGFTTGTPWIDVNENYVTINAKNQVNDPDSIYSYYKRLIALRHELDIIVYGSYELLLPEDTKIYAYTRTWENEKLVVICNFTEEQIPCSLLEECKNSDTKLLIGNYHDEPSNTLRPFEAVVYYS